MRRLSFHRCSSVQRGTLSRGFLSTGGFCPQGGLCPEGVSVQEGLSRGVSVQRGFLSRRVCPGGSLFGEGSLYQGVSVHSGDAVHSGPEGFFIFDDVSRLSPPLSGRCDPVRAWPINLYLTAKLSVKLKVLSNKRLSVHQGGLPDRAPHPGQRRF